MSFRFVGVKVHLADKTHLELEEFKGKILWKFLETKLWSFVHENGDTDEENPTPYEHIHTDEDQDGREDSQLFRHSLHTPEFTYTNLFSMVQNIMFELPFGTQDEEGREEVFYRTRLFKPRRYRHVEDGRGRDGDSSRSSQFSRRLC